MNSAFGVKTAAGGPRAALATLGCKVNQCESEAMTEALETRGFRMVPFSAEADCYIVNTCTVTGRTDYQSRQMIRRAIRANPRALIVVTGCYAQTNAADLARIEGVTMIVGNREKGSLPQLIEDWWIQNKSERSGPQGRQNRVSAFGEDDAFEMADLERFTGHTRAFLKVQDGCNARCSYCIVPYARGRSRSLHPDTIIERISRLADRSYREVVLTGIHLGAFGQDLTPATDLTALLERIEAQRSIERLRISSIEPREVTDDFLELFKKAMVICPHLHIPLQSGDDTVLSLMNRNYTGSFFRALVEKVVAIRPEAAVGLDVMVGFPGEDEAAFQRTCRLIEELPVAYLHVFPYSKRPGTPAADMAGQVPDDRKKTRAACLRELGLNKRRLFMERFICKPLQVLIEGRIDKKTGFYKGFSQNYLPVMVVNGRAPMINKIVTVVADKWDGSAMIGEVVHD
ncbi:MAG: Threonylcarbamoyladenosine tRNA methylthiotransferase MtaB [Syntrophus sp. SKADARSKE-3]|nr:Threonylcarbamoyladenosine tRNA methylthiotransferase MtaB [Syntrophus sp. SKADARSKE-3]